MEESPLLANLRIASPCNVSWEKMQGDNQVRFCQSCELHVYNLSELTTPEISQLFNTKGRICGRIYRRSDGKVMTKDCPVGLKALRKRMAKRAGAVLTAIMSFAGIISAQSGTSQKNDNASVQTSQQSTTRRQSDQNQQASFKVIVLDETSAVIRDAELTLTNNNTKSIATAKTSEFGEFSFNNLPAGSYTLEVKCVGFKPIKLQKLTLRSQEETRSQIIMKVEVTYALVGILDVSPSIEMSNGTTIIRSEALQKLPIRN